MSVVERGGDASQPEIDLLMASLRADEADASTYFKALRFKLVDSLGSRASASSEGGRLFSRDPPNRLSVASNQSEFVAKLRGGRIECTVRHVVKGIALRTDEVELSAWLQQLVQSLRAEAEQSESARHALEKLLT